MLLAILRCCFKRAARFAAEMPPAYTAPAFTGSVVVGAALSTPAISSMFDRSAVKVES